MKKGSKSNGKATKRPHKESNGSSSSSSPVYVATPETSSPRQEPFGLGSQSLLKDLLYPLSPNEFMTKYFRKQAVHVKGSDAKIDSKKKSSKRTQEESTGNRYQPIIEDGMYNLDTEQLVKETSSDSIFVWLAAADTKRKPQNGNRYNNPLIQSIEVYDLR